MALRAIVLALVLALVLLIMAVLVAIALAVVALLLTIAVSGAAPMTLLFSRSHDDSSCPHSLL